MTVYTQRTQAYGRVMRTLADLGPSKLQNDEVERIRYAADELFFSDEFNQNYAADMELLLGTLVDSGRWTDATAHRLLQDLLGCGPGLVAPVTS